MAEVLDHALPLLEVEERVSPTAAEAADGVVAVGEVSWGHVVRTDPVGAGAVADSAASDRDAAAGAGDGGDGYGIVRERHAVPALYSAQHADDGMLGGLCATLSALLQSSPTESSLGALLGRREAGRAACAGAPPWCRRPW